MLPRAEFHQLVANILRCPVSDVTPEASLTLNSFDRAKLNAAVLRHFGKKPDQISHARTYGELETLLFTAEANPSSTDDQSGPIVRARADSTSAVAEKSEGILLSAEANLKSQNVRCGIDIEPVASLPHSEDYWEDSFYRAIFTPAEIAYCIAQPEPAMHFAARWCAKEALRKCDPRFAMADYTEVELIRNEAGNLLLRYHHDGATETLPHAVSVTHTPEIAASVVVLGTMEAPTSAQPDPVCAECAQTARLLRQSQTRLLKSFGDDGQEIWVCTACLSASGQPVVMGFE